MNDSLVSVVMPMYNSERFILDSVKSILSQTHRELELLIVNDCSTDGSLKNIGSISDERIKIFSNDRQLGISRARNVGIEKSLGRYIAFCDSDDIWHPEKLSLQLHHMHKTGSHVSHTNAIIISQNGGNIGKRIFPEMINFNKLIIRNYILNSSGIYDAVIIGKIYQKDLRHEDYYMWLEILSRSFQSIGVNECLVSYRVHDSNSSKNKFKSFWWMLLVQRKNGLTVVEIIVGVVKNIYSRYRDLIR
jgi:teichuronic acid biosynthesis glycosyltransferase TuaG